MELLIQTTPEALLLRLPPGLIGVSGPASRSPAEMFVHVAISCGSAVTLRVDLR